MKASESFENPFDITRTEYFNSKFDLIADYFKEPSFYGDLMERERFIIVGSRGTGKSMILKSLYLPVFAETLIKKGIDPVNTEMKFVGVYVPCDNLDLQKYFSEEYLAYFGGKDLEKGGILWKKYLGNYFALFIIRQVLHTILAYGKKIGIDLSGDRKIAEEVLKQYDPSSLLKKSELAKDTDDLPTFFEKERKLFLDFVMKRIFDSSVEYDHPIRDLSFIKDVCYILLDRIARLNGCRFYILLDDFFPPFVTLRQQAVLLDLIRERGGPLSFKITTLPEGMTYTTDEGYEMRPDLDYTQKFLEYSSVGRGSEYWEIIKEITDKRLERYNTEHSALLQDPDQAIEDFLKRLKGESSKGHDRPVYAGFDMIVEMSSGVVGTYLLLLKEMVNFLLKSKRERIFGAQDLPIPVSIQDQVIRSRSDLFLGAILSLKHGQSIYKLVTRMAQESRSRFLMNQVANEYIQYKIKNYEDLLAGNKEAHSRLVVAFQNNILHSPDSHPTDRQKNVILKTLILNRLLTPALRIPYRDRWAFDIEAKEISKLLLSEPSQPLPEVEEPSIQSEPNPLQTYLGAKPTSAEIQSSFCSLFSDYCSKTQQLLIVENGPFLAIPFREDWHKVTEKLIKERINDTKTSLDVSPNGDFTCKICESIHKKEQGIYEISTLNANVIFEMGLSLGAGKHTFPIWNQESWAKTWDGKDSPISFLIDGLEGLPYYVDEKSIEELIKSIKETSSGEPWNKTMILRASRPHSVFLALPIRSHYYRNYLWKEASNALVETGIESHEIISLPDDFKAGVTFQNTFKWILESRLCIIDTTQFPHYRDNLELTADYLWRMFSLGVAVGLRKSLIHCFNMNYTLEVASDLIGKCSFYYKDAELHDKLVKALEEVKRK